MVLETKLADPWAPRVHTADEALRLAEEATPQPPVKEPPLAAHVAAVRETRPTRIFSGKQGPAITLAERTYHLVIHNIASIRDFQAWYNEQPSLTIVADTSLSEGGLLVEGAIQSGSFTFLRELLERAIIEPLPADVELEASPDELVQAIDLFLHQNGFKWLSALLKNSLAEHRLGELILNSDDPAGLMKTIAEARSIASTSSNRPS